MSIKSLIVSASVPLPARQLSSLLQHHLQIPRAQIPLLLEQGCVSVNGRIRRQGFQTLEVGDAVAVDVIPNAVQAPRKSSKSKEVRRVIEFLHDDESIVVVNKPANLLTVPTRHREAHTLLSLAEKRLQKQQPGLRLFCVHRLDRGVSGVLVFAKSLEVAEELRNQFADRKPERRYIALVVGVPRIANDTLRNYLATDENLNRYMVAKPEQGELAITHYRTKQAWQDAALLEIELETGRRNQIRVQLAEIGHPIVGDPRYRARQAMHWAWPHERIGLHAERLGFKHPTTHEPMLFETTWPQEFRDFLRHQKKRVES
jgi:23S rRNA pseudouridine1911/1915/1917 synthase